MTAQYFLPSSLLRWLSLGCIAMGLSACNSTNSGMKGLPSNLPNIPLYDSSHTPPHSLSHSDYPFSPDGRYVTSWAAEGGERADASSITGSHHSDDTPSPKSKSKSKAVPVPKAKSSSGSSATSKTGSKSTSPPSKPKGKASGRTHVVKSTDSLFGIAKKYGTTVAKIKAANDLTSDNIRDGRKLVIP
jgi:LysM repeat protein